VSRRFRPIGELLGSAFRLLAIYASVRAALRAEAIHSDRTGRIRETPLGAKRDRLHDHDKSVLEDHWRREASAEPAARTTHAVPAPTAGA
jgi:hypothetical protein